MRSALISSTAVAALLWLTAPAALAQPAPLPEPAAPTAAIAAPVDQPYPGTLRINVDATDTDRRIFWVRETVPVAAAGDMVLLYPKWLPGHHSPSGPLEQFAGLLIHANGKPLEWTRDPVEMGAFHITVPQGVGSIEVEFQYLSPTDGNQGRIMVTPEMLSLQWNAMALYPAGYYTRQIPVEASVRFPEGWSFGSALEAAGKQRDGSTLFKTVSFETLIDSPMIAGRYFRQVDLDPGGRSPVRLDIVADRPEQLDIKDEQLAQHRALITQADKLYGARHYDHYDFLLSVSDRLGGIGLEHHRSSEDGVKPNYFTEWDKSSSHDLLPHEYTHSWNGKFRRGADLWTPDFNILPMRDSLLWVYEGQTQYWGNVLAARAGLNTKQQALDALANVAATYDNRVGREWRALADTTNGPIIANRRPQAWVSWERTEDYYSEGQLVWLDVDTLLREKSDGKLSLDNFAHAFFGIQDGSYTSATYTFDDVVRTLNEVMPYDWATFLKTRLDGHGPGAPLDGLARGGYRLVYTDQPQPESSRAGEEPGSLNLTYSLGLSLNKDGILNGVQWNGVAFKAGLTVGAQVVAVNGITYNADRLRGAVKQAVGDKAPIELLIKRADHYTTVKLDYHGGLRYPHLERIEGQPARLDDILAAR